MPTPALDQTSLPQLHDTIASATQHRPLRATCPPEDDCAAEVIAEAIDTDTEFSVEEPEIIDIPAPAVEHIERPESDSPPLPASTPVSLQESETDGESSIDPSSPIPAQERFIQTIIQPSEDRNARNVSQYMSPFGGIDAPPIRSPRRYYSSYLKAGSIFEGTQQSDRQVYKVQVEIKYVDMSESFVCGYLRIEGLTSEHPTLTTYFDGEIIGPKYSFVTKHSDWGSSEKVDMQHWNRFPAFKPLQRAARNPLHTFKSYAERDTMFMRWKEDFLVPDHKVKMINGASFEGFYYIAMDMRRGGVSGIYFHSKSEKFQQLELKHVDDHGCTAAMEFR